MREITKQNAYTSMKKGFMNSKRSTPSKKSVPFWKQIGWDAPPKGKGSQEYCMNGIRAASAVASDMSGDDIYETLRQYEMDNDLTDGSLVNWVRHSQGNSIRRFAKEPIDTSANGMCFHAWIRKPDGSIHDPHFKEYDWMMKMPNCDANEKVYDEWSPTQQKEKLRNEMPSLIDVMKDNREINNSTNTEIAEFLIANPQYRACIFNAFCYKIIHPDCEIVIGNMGFRNKKTPSIIWWEY